MYLKDSLDFFPILSLKLFLPFHLFLFSCLLSDPCRLCVCSCVMEYQCESEKDSLSLSISLVYVTLCFCFPISIDFNCFFFLRTRCTTYPFFKLFKNPRGICKQIFKKFLFFYLKRNVENPTPSAKRRKPTNFMC